jgi:hypothetical protein
MSKEDEIKKYMEKLQISRDEAEQLYYDDHSDEVLPEVAEMEKKAKSMGRRYENDKTADRKKTSKPKKEDAEKRRLIELFNYTLLEPTIVDSELPFVISDVSIKNLEREILFTVGENEYSITLTKHRKSKEK